MTEVEVVVNGDRREIAVGTSVEALVTQFAGGRGGVAVALNLEVIPMSLWAQTIIQQGDRIEVLSAAQGG